MLKPYFNKSFIEAGCDEAGRGCLSGPVFAAAVILPKDFKNKIINDSKKLSEKVRYELREIIEKEAISFGVAQVSPKEIDKINILNASFLAMHRALDKLDSKPQSLLIDGNRFNRYKSIPHRCIIEGDGKYLLLQQHQFWLKLIGTIICTNYIRNILCTVGIKIKGMERKFIEKQ